MSINFSKLFKHRLEARFNESSLKFSEDNNIEKTNNDVPEYLFKRIVNLIENANYTKAVFKISKYNITPNSVCSHIVIGGTDYYNIHFSNLILIALAKSNNNIPLSKVLTLAQDNIFKPSNICRQSIFSIPLAIGKNKIDIISYILTMRILSDNSVLEYDEIDLDVSSIIDFFVSNDYDLNIKFGFLQFILKYDLMNSFKKIIKYYNIQPDSIQYVNKDLKIGKNISIELHNMQTNKFAFQNPDVIFKDGKIYDGDIVKMFCGIGYNIQDNTKIYTVDRSFPKILAETILVTKKRYESNGMVFNDEIENLVGKDSELYDIITLIRNMKHELRSLNKSHKANKNNPICSEITKSIENNYKKLEILTNKVLDYIGFPNIKLSKTH